MKCDCGVASAHASCSIGFVMYMIFFICIRYFFLNVKVDGIRHEKKRKEKKNDKLVVHLSHYKISINGYKNDGEKKRKKKSQNNIITTYFNKNCLIYIFLI